ncbi:MAG TPA: hypothetical protein VF989_06820 [Polyangiaceae bacterium]
MAAPRGSGGCAGFNLAPFAVTRSGVSLLDTLSAAHLAQSSENAAEHVPGAIVHSGDVVPTCPSLCSCCLRVASATVRERGRGRTLLVPYCDECLGHASRTRTRVLSLSSSGVLLVAAAGASLPWLGAAIPGPVRAALLVVAGLLPIALARLFAPRRASGHTAALRAVWWRRDGTLGCRNAAWARLLAPVRALEVAHLREPWFSPWIALGLGLALSAGPLLDGYFRPWVRIVNLTDGTLTIHVDGRPVATVEPTSAESGAAGARVRVPAGARRLQAVRADGAVMSSVAAAVLGGHEHLYAPASDEHCFWIEQTGYGRAAAGGSRVAPLAGRGRFWGLPTTLDTWFAPNPPEPRWPFGVTGGVLHALRQAPCEEAPAAARAP